MKTIKTTYLLLTCVFLAWLLLSWLEIVFKCTFGGATYSDYNIITNTLYYFKIIW